MDTRKRQISFRVEIPMATGVGKSRRVRLNEASGCNAILSRDVASHDILDWWYYSRGISSTRMAKPMHGTSHQQKAETGAASLKAIPPAKRRHILPIVLLLLMLVACRPCHGHDRELFDMDNEDGNGAHDSVQPPGPLAHIVSVVKGKTSLPCDITPLDDDDQASLVLFYKDGASQSIYTYDARDKYANRPRHWSDENVLGKRAFFSKLQSNTSSSGRLMIDNVHETDVGLYRCRVDFKRSPTRNSRVNLTVVVPPKQMKITNEKGVDVGDLIGPFDEGVTLILVCIVTGGNPLPEVTWWQEEKMIDRHVEVRQYSENSVASNVLQFERLGRADLRTKLSCHASNSLLAQTPLTKSVEIELNLKPLDVRILSSRQPLSSGKKYELTCQTTGSRPSPKVTWWKDGHLLRHSQETQYDTGNITLSQLAVQLTPEDDGKKLVCRAENAVLGAASAIEDTWLLNVYYVPRVRLELGRNLQGDHIREGIDVYFNCHVTARPSGVRLVWRHQSQVLHHNVSAGVIISETSLVLQRVARSATGRYTCHASNAEGEGSSAPFHLNVAHKPVCRAEQKNFYGGAKGLTSEVECHVDAKPATTGFRWAFNGSGELLNLTSEYRSIKEESVSVLRYTPRNHLDFGTLLCWATNSLGIQTRPCVYHFYTAGVPDPPRNCSITNQTLSSFEIDCAEGYDGGIPQHFKMHVFDIKTRALLANLTSSSPKFALHLGSTSSSSMPQSSTLGNNGPGEAPKTHSWKASSNSSSNSISSDYGIVNNKTTRRHSHNWTIGGIAVIPPVGTLLQVTAVNAHGVSESVLIEATQQAVVGLLPAGMQSGGSFSNLRITSTLGILIGIIVVAVCAIFILLVALHLRKRKKLPVRHNLAVVTDEDKDRDINSYNGTDEYLELDAKDPDIISKDAQGLTIPRPTRNRLEVMANSQSSSI